jgi:RNA polymerase sigma-70 factor, ECF subfamily
VATLSGGDEWQGKGTGPALTVRGTGGFERLVRDNCDRLIQTLSLVALDRDHAADAAQEAFLQLHLHLNEVDAPIPWLYRVALNRCLDYRRRLARRARLLERLVGSSSPEDWIAPEMETTSFRDTLAGLPLKQRTAATLYYLADFSTAEIASVMNISEGSVDRHLYRARVALRKTLEDAR